MGPVRHLRGSEAVKKSTVARIASATTPAARRADETMLVHRGGGATKQTALSRRKTGRRGFLYSLSGSDPRDRGDQLLGDERLLHHGRDVARNRAQDRVRRRRDEDDA